MTAREAITPHADAIRAARSKGETWRNIRKRFELNGIPLPSLSRVWNTYFEEDDDASEDDAPETPSLIKQIADEAGIPTSHVKMVWSKSEQYSALLDNPHAGIDFEALCDRLVNAFATAPPLPPLPAVRGSGDVCVIAPLTDLHLGSLGLYGETIKDTYKRFKAATDASVQFVKGQSFQVDRVIIPSLGDLIHTDGYAAMTTAGTPQDVACHPEDMHEIAAKCAEYMVRRFAELEAPIDVVFVPGNHDWNTTHLLAMVIEARFQNDDSVTVLRGKEARKYITYGDTLLAFDHGHKVKPSDLPRILDNEARHLLGNTKRTIWLRGHRHKLDIETIGRLQVRTVPALAHLDRWHHREGYFAQPAAQLHFIDKRRGPNGVYPIFPN